jgi:hypothetical protein
VALGDERSAELSATVNAFILRRTNRLLSNHLPPKVRCEAASISNPVWGSQQAPVRRMAVLPAA